MANSICDRQGDIVEQSRCCLLASSAACWALCGAMSRRCKDEDEAVDWGGPGVPWETAVAGAAADQDDAPIAGAAVTDSGAGVPVAGAAVTVAPAAAAEAGDGAAQAANAPVGRPAGRRRDEWAQWADQVDEQSGRPDWPPSRGIKPPPAHEVWRWHYKDNAWWGRSYKEGPRDGGLRRGARQAHRSQPT